LRYVSNICNLGQIVIMARYYFQIKNRITLLRKENEMTTYLARLKGQNFLMVGDIVFNEVFHGSTGMAHFKKSVAMRDSGFTE